MKDILNRNAIIMAIVCLLVGRYVLSPKQKTKEVVKIVTVEKQHVDTKKKVFIREVKKKDGTIVKETTEVENTIVDTSKNTKLDSTTTKEEGFGLTIGALAILNANDYYQKPQYGATISVPVFGSLNAQGLVTTDARIGLGLSISF